MTSPPPGKRRMFTAFAADALVVFHAAFIVFALFGGVLALLHRGWIGVHLPTVLWAALVVIMGWTCPLTPCEQSLRQAAGQQGYSGGFIDHYLLAAIYPAGLTRTVQVALGVGVVVFNLVVYAVVFRPGRTG